MDIEHDQSALLVPEVKFANNANTDNQSYICCAITGIVLVVVIIIIVYASY
jgi:hypothetical protein